MASFASGILGALILAAGTYFAMEAWTVTAVERFDTDATLIGGIWDEGTFRSHEAATPPDGT